MSGKMRQPAPPPAPSPQEIAQTDATYNRIDQITPFGNLTYSGPERNVATLSLDPELQQLYDSRVQSDQGMLNLANQALPGIQGLVNQPLSVGGPNLSMPNLQSAPQPGVLPYAPQFSGGPTPGALPNAPNLQGNIGSGPSLDRLNTAGLPGLPSSANAYRGDVERAFFDRSSGLLNEQFGREEDRLRQQLANQGIQAGSEAFGSELGQFNQRRGETYSNLARDATLFGGQEASRTLADQLALRGTGFNENLTQAGFGNQASQQEFQNRIAGTQFGNQAAQQGFQNALGLQGTQFAQGQSAADFANQYAQQNFQNLSGQQDTLFNQGLTSANFANQNAQQQLQNSAAIRSQLLGEQQAVRGGQFNELASLLGLQQTQAPGLQNFFAPSQVGVSDAYALNQASQQNSYNARSRAASAAKGDFSNLLQTAMSGGK